MAFTLSTLEPLRTQPSLTPTLPNRTRASSPCLTTSFYHFLPIRKLKTRAPNRRFINAVEESQEERAESDETPKADGSKESGLVAEEIKKAMIERKERDFWSGVADEVEEIEWPVFGKVLGTTGVVLGVIAGSSVVLLTVNAVLAELSDRVFLGKGVQDFFS
ncbi:hypothetical protein K2173_008760 [Erythroxylum novogranatense]|uniref:Preprotein translocase subunit SECE1 n=1 Tax=Erythroxylum novogranatense TaxID=1862640 RepID=A0AAV8S5L1_9ROSI|nr:hypothetical protein K2173_008760 [Erythroxylum novogranatense]